LTIEKISCLLFYSCGLTKPHRNPNHSRRPHPSGGGLYPIEIYPLIFVGTKGIGKGLYHYNISGHFLEKLPEKDIEALKSAFRYPWVADTAMTLLLSFTEARTKPKYGNFAYKVGLIEAGHIGQNIYLTCAALGLKCCALGGFDAETLHRALDLDGVSEVLFYALAVGR
jgi:SagB-type dehydrogenase family enzyme